MIKCNHVELNFVNITEGHGYGKEEWDLDNTDFRNMPWGKIFQGLRKEYGRCTSKVFIDNKDPKKSVHIGWCFESTQEYTDTKEKYIQVAWVTFFKKVPAIAEYPVQ